MFPENELAPTLSEPLSSFLVGKEIAESKVITPSSTSPEAKTGEANTSSAEKKLFWQDLDERTQKKIKLLSIAGKKEEKAYLELVINTHFTRLKVEEKESPSAQADLSTASKEKLERIAALKKVSPIIALKEMIDHGLTDKSFDTLVKLGKA